MSGVTSWSFSFLSLYLSSSSSFSSSPVRSLHRAISLTLVRTALNRSLVRTRSSLRYIDLRLSLCLSLSPSLPSTSSSTRFFHCPPSFPPASSLSGSHYLLITSYLVTCYPSAPMVDPLTGQSGARKRADAHFLAANDRNELR